jgi:UDP-N-acetylmuramoyl-tripeptide--D-alanyl-D-alanine ligase
MKELYSKYLDSTGISIDSRKIENGNLFFALKGPNFNGNQFAMEAIEKGALFSIIDEPDKLENHPQIIPTENVLRSLQDLAKYHRTQFQGTVFALTGSNGKTTTKELIAAVLKQKYKVHYTPGNYNNLIGLPFTLLNMPPETEFLILEMGANGPGEIQALCDIAQPDSGLITNIGKAHLEGFGSIEGVKKAKSDLYQSLKKTNGTVFVNLDENYLEELSRTSSKRVFYGKKNQTYSHQLSLSASMEKSFPQICINYRWKGEPEKIVNSQLPGAYNFGNIISAIVVAKFYGLNDKQLAEGIYSYQPKNNRSQWIKLDENQFYMDAYNANPSSMRASLFDFLDNCPDQPVLILGDMREVGKASFNEHQSLVNELYNIQDKFKELWLVGTEFQKVTTNENTLKFKNSTEAAQYFKNRNYTGATFFLKGSRGIELEKIIS